MAKRSYQLVQRFPAKRGKLLSKLVEAHPLAFPNAHNSRSLREMKAFRLSLDVKPEVMGKKEKIASRIDAYRRLNLKKVYDASGLFAREVAFLGYYSPTPAQEVWEELTESPRDKNNNRYEGS